MAITSVIQADDPGWVLSPLIYTATTDSVSPFTRIRARIFIKETPTASTWTFVTELEHVPDDSGDCTFYIQDALREFLSSDYPSLPYKLEIYEWGINDLTLVEELYHETAGGAWVDISPVDTAKNYLIISETDETLTLQFNLGANNELAALIGKFGAEQWHKLETPSYAYDSVNISEPYTKVYIYEIPAIPTIEEITDKYCVLGSYGFFGRDEDYLVKVHGGSVNFDTFTITGEVVIDWGDGTHETVPVSTFDLSHTYKDPYRTYNIKIFSGATKITRANIIFQPTVVAVDYANLKQITYVRVTSCADMDNIILPATVVGITNLDVSNNALITALDLSGMTNLSGTIRLSGNPLLAALTMPASGGAISTFTINGTALGTFDISMFTFTGTFDYGNCGMVLADQDANIDHIYTNRANFTTPTLTVIGDGLSGNGVNATPSGTYDGTTDWSGGLPTSPMAKIYDLVNNVTGTYNFTFNDIP